MSDSFGAPRQRPDARVLIWVEGAAEWVREAAVGRHRSMIIVAHGAGRGSIERSFIISYPLGTDKDGRQARAVAGVLEAMGWSVLASQRGGKADEHGNSGMLVSNARPGSQRQLWLAEQVRALQPPTPRASALASGSCAASADGGVRTREIRDPLGVWVNKGGAGRDGLSRPSSPARRSARSEDLRV